MDVNESGDGGEGVGRVPTLSDSWRETVEGSRCWKPLEPPPLQRYRAKSVKLLRTLLRKTHGVKKRVRRSGRKEKEKNSQASDSCV